MDLHIATADDICDVLELYGKVIDAMRGTSHDIHWDLAWHPSEEFLRESVLAQEMILAFESDELFGALVINSDWEDVYGDLPWQVVDTGAWGVVHVLAVSPKARGRGVARALMDGADEVARSRGLHALRLDVIERNTPALVLYRQNGWSDIARRERSFKGGVPEGVWIMEKMLG